MNPDIYHGGFYCSYKKREPSLAELQNQVSDINRQIREIDRLNISDAVKLCAKAELEEKKAELVKAMHKCIDEMYS